MQKIAPANIYVPDFLIKNIEQLYLIGKFLKVDVVINLI